MAQSGIYFFIGTEAELIKLFPVMLQLQAQQVPYHIIASGQNDIVKSTILRALNGGHVDLELSKESDIKKSVVCCHLAQREKGHSCAFRQRYPARRYDGRTR